MTLNGVSTIGLIGAGNIGSQVARAVIAAGYDVVISNSRGPDTLADLIADLGPRARAAQRTGRRLRVTWWSSPSRSKPSSTSQSSYWRARR